MTTKPLLLLAALTLCCCIASLQARPRRGCLCLHNSPNPMPLQVIKDIKVIPISGHCRRIEVIITRKNGVQVCVKPDSKWITNLLITLQNKTAASGSTTAPPTDSTVDF